MKHNCMKKIIGLVFSILLITVTIAQAGLVDNSDGTITDTSTGIMWQKASYPATLTWEAAITYCEALSLADYDDWRLPNRNELQSIVDYSKTSPAIDETFFPDTVISYYWSSTTDAGVITYAWRVHFSYGYQKSWAKTSSHYVRSVRAGGQPIVSGNLFITTPDQASIWKPGHTMTIEWEISDIAENVTISLSRDGGKTYTEIFTNIENTGSKEWVVTVPESANCMLKIEPVVTQSKGTTQGLFSIALNNLPPNTPATPYPADGATDVNLNIEFSWTGGDSDPGDTVTYDIYADANNPPITQVSSDQTGTTFSATADPKTTYYWKVIATDNYGESTEGPVWQFTTKASSMPWLSLLLLQDETAPSGYSVSIDQTTINSDNETALSFTFANAETGATYNYSIDDAANGLTDPVTDTGTITTATDQITNIDVSSLDDGTLTLTVYLTDVHSNQGDNVTDTVTKEIITPTPGNSGTITSASVDTTTLTLNWALAADDVSDPADLQYLAYYSTSNNIDSVANCEANGTAVGSYDANIATRDVTGLTGSTTYYFNVIVKDEAGNKALYSTLTQATVDETSPTPGTSGTITEADVTATSLILNWTKATDDVSAEATLQYLAYYSTNTNIDTVAECVANGTAVGSYATDIATKEIAGLTADTTYYFNVVVKDEAGNEAPYSKLTQATLSE